MLGKKNPSQGPKVLDVDASLQGNLLFKDEVNLHINGNFEGRLETKGDLLIGEQATVKANISGERITIAGHVQGDITALSEMRIAPTGRLTGNVRTPSLIIERGGVFNGESSMGAQEIVSGRGRQVFLTIDEVANYLSVEGALISEWAESGKLPAEREGRNWRFDKEKVDEWVANGRIA